VKALADADFVVENVTEDWAAKSAVYRDLDRACRDGVAFAVNTSAIPITRVASVTGRPDRVLGMHFMNPVHLMPMVEMLRGHFTSPETVDLAHRLLATIGKEGILVEDAPGFVTNRVLMPIINEAIFAVQDGLATAEQVDRIFKGCFGTGWDPWKPATGLAWTRS
jgi:3-hydroxybutyryl-CoA dehydrogenase